MIDHKLRYQAVLFGDISFMEANANTMKTFLDLFSDQGLMPSIFQEHVFPSPTPLNRLMLSNPNSGLTIHFANQRIDIAHQPIDTKGNNLGEIKSFISIVKDILSKLSKVYHRLSFNRLSLIANYLLKEMSMDEINNIHDKFFNNNINLDGGSVTEWGFRHVVRKDFDLAGLSTKETVNSIVQIDRVQGFLGQPVIPVQGVFIPEALGLERIDRIQLLLDLNTIPEHTDFRFSNDKIDAFYDAILIQHDTLIKNIGALI